MAVLAAIAVVLSAIGARAQTENVTTTSLQPGQVVAELELGAPSILSFTLHGTLPVPPRLVLSRNRKSPFVIESPSGAITPAQVDIVSAYPNDGDGADVVEITSQVTRPAGSQPGDRIRYRVKYSPHVQPALAVESDVGALLAQPASVLVRTRDCFGNFYSGDLYADVRAPGSSPGSSFMHKLRSGEAVDQVATHTTLLPDNPQTGPQGTLPHMMGVHAYIERVAHEPFFALDLRVHNGASGANHQSPIDDPLGKIYFASLELRLPQGWTLLNAIPDPYFGAPYVEGAYRVWPIVAPIGGGKLHMMPAMSQFHRRLAVVKDGFVARAQAHIQESGLAFAVPGESSPGLPYFSWWNASTARFFPQRQRLPSLDFMGLAGLRNVDQLNLDARLAQVATGAAGSWPAQSPGLGWADPWGTPDGGMVSGEEIQLYDGITTACAASTAGYRMHELRHRMYTDRQRNVLYDQSGQPTSLAEWIVPGPNGPTVPIWWYNEPLLWASDPFGFNNAPTFQQNYVAAQGLAPTYESALAGFAPIDEAHLVRYLHDAMALVWLGNDALAKDDIRAQAEDFHLGYHQYPQDNYGAIQPTGLLAAQNYVAQHPGWGFAYGRAEAWGLDAMCAAFSTQNAEWRASNRSWFDLVLDVVTRGQSTCSGIIQATGLENVFNSQYRCRQSIEAAITENALVGLRESVYRGSDLGRSEQVNRVLVSSLYSMIGPLVWVDAWAGPRALMAVGPFDGNAPPFCTYVPPDGTYDFADHYQIWCSFAYGYSLTGDPIFLQRATQAAGGGDLLQSLMAESLDSILTNIPNQVALLALMQSLP
jgi:hypothetical protein